MVLVAIDFTEYDLTHMDEHTLACNIRDYLLSKYVDGKCDYKFAVKESRNNISFKKILTNRFSCSILDLQNKKHHRGCRCKSRLRLEWMSS